jgi:hypothetical protein
MPLSYKVFFSGARGTYMRNNTGHDTTLRLLKAPPELLIDHALPV